MKKKILIVEDDKDIVELLTLYLEGNGFEVESTDNGLDAYNMINEKDFDLVLADVMMPVMNGYELIKKLRQEKNNIPIIILSAKSMDIDRILGLNIGADCYITKPFNPLEVIACINALLRRIGGNEVETIINIGSLSLDLEKFTLKKNEKTIVLTSTEIKILSKMMKNPNRIFTKSQLYKCVNDDSLVDENTVIVHISNLRSKIEDDPANPKYIKTVRGLGYKFEDEKR